MMTTGLDSLSPSQSKILVHWILPVLVAVLLPVCGWATQIGEKTPTNSGNIARPSVVVPQPQRYSSRIGNTSPSSSVRIPSFTPVQQPSGNRFLPSPPVLTGGKKDNFLPPPVKTGSAEGEPYTVGSPDILAIEVFDNPDLKGKYTVSENGNIIFPLIGQVKVSGKTPDAIKKEITRLLEKDYLFNPIVNVDVSKYLSRQVKVMGNVKQPGIYYLDGPTRLFDILTKAGGVAKQSGGTFMGGQKVHITRSAPSQTTSPSTSPDNVVTYYVDLHQLLVSGKDDVNIYLQSGDLIVIPDASTFHVIGEVKRPGVFPFEEGITLLKAISLADGLTEKGSSDSAVIKRLQNDRVIEVKASMDTLLAAEDTVYIPEDTNYIHVVGQVKKPNSFPYEKGITLLKAINYAGGAILNGSVENAVIKRRTNGRTIEIKGGIDTVLQPDDTVFVPKAKSIEVIGEVKRPGSIPYESGMTLLKTIDIAGGPTLEGSAENAVIKRLSNGRIVEMKASMYTSVQPGDTVFVPKSRSVEVIGEVKQPGSIPYEPGMSLLKAIDLAGGATLKGSAENSVIKRQKNGQVVEMKADRYTSLQPDDTIYVPEVRSFHVTGEVKNPGSFLHEPRLTLLRAIAMAGGATKKAAPKNSIIKRVKNGKVEEIEATMDKLILPDDVIEVPLSFW
jgi:protein involved in polysaccharide export with SLBB domain